jgi:ubiquinone/menaquinone biosynthesis C-methylase UbiE
MNKNQYNEYTEIFSKHQCTDINYRNDMHNLFPNLKNKKVLDLGCGDGEDLKFFIKSEASMVCGIDASEKFLKIAKTKASDAKLICGDFCTKLAFQDDFFDIVYSQFAINHEKNIEFIFEEVYRVLKPNGIFLLLVTHHIRQFLVSNTKDYSANIPFKEIFFDGEVCVQSYTHRIEEYLSVPILSKFNLLKLKEGFFNDEEKYNDKWIYPSYLILKYKKKEIL